LAILFGKLIFSADKKLIRSLRNLLGFTPGNTALYRQAFRHRSALNDPANQGVSSNERLEYLGDAVLGAVIAELLFKKFPYKEEGFLTEMRSRIVSREQLNKLAMKIGLDEFLDENTDRSSRTKSLYGDAFEALIGAIYLDKGYKQAQQFILGRIIKNHLDLNEVEATEKNFKSKLIEWAQKEKIPVSFELVEELPAGGNKKQMKVRVVVKGEEKGTGIDFSKKKAEQIAAEQTCKMMGLL
jgi:ribonuclease-3